MIKSFSNISFGSTPTTQQKPKETKLSILYFNDFHGQSSPFERLKTQSDIFDATHRNSDGDTLKLSAGDMNIGVKDKENNFVTKILNTLGIDAATIGNHETDRLKNGLNEYIKNASFPYLSINLSTKNPSKEDAAFKNSTIVEKNGNKYGIIGASPLDLLCRSEESITQNFNIDSTEETLKKITAEIDSLKKQGVDKVILLAHIESAKCEEIAQKLSGVDIIVSGHSHDLIKGAENGKNLVQSATGEPVIVVQAGKDGKYCGELDVVFDENGVLKQLSNQIIPLEDKPKNLEARYLKDLIFGKANPIGNLTKTYDNPNSIISEDALSSFLADSTYNKFDCDLVLINGGSTRGKLIEGTVTDRDVLELIPFKNNLYRTKISEKDLVDTIATSGKTLVANNSKPGLMQVSHLKYTLDKQGNLKELSMIDKKGNLIPINIQNPSKEKMFTAVYRGYLIEGKDGFSMLKQDKSKAEEFLIEPTDCAVEEIKKLNGKPFELKTDGRIKIEDAEKSKK